jgi:hypothetical protein
VFQVQIHLQKYWLRLLLKGLAVVVTEGKKTGMVYQDHYLVAVAVEQGREINRVAMAPMG